MDMGFRDVWDSLLFHFGAGSACSIYAGLRFGNEISGF